MKSLSTHIIPDHPTFAKINASQELNKEAICVFTAIGFFLDRDTYRKDKIVVPPGSVSTFGDKGFFVDSKVYFKWHYSPRDISFQTALQEFTQLFHSIIEEQVGNRKVILPLSGGLDSRTQAVALHKLGKKVHSYSYDFKGGYPETKIAKQIAKSCGFAFSEYHIEKGYLWNCMEELSEINQCYSDFTHPRQMAIINEFEDMGDVFSLGHWGDVLFDDMTLKTLSTEEEINYILKSIIKKGGEEIANSLWKEWNLEGNFKEYLKNRVEELLSKIDIDNSSAKIRAFKSIYWAPRWTSVNLSVFQEKKPITLPYYDDRMCKFICTIPEDYLANRRLQIEYIKQQNPDLAKITWQSHKPYNLFTYKNNKSPSNLPYRVLNKTQRELKALFGKPYIQRNWELQFLGEENKKKLESYLFSETLEKLIPTEITQEFYRKFETQDKVWYSHPVSMLLTLSLKMKQLSKEN